MNFESETARVIREALTEDLGPEGLDVTTIATIPPDQTDIAELVARADGVIAGLGIALEVFEAVWESANSLAEVFDPIEVVRFVKDGDRVRAGTILATLTGSTRVLLSAERTALNLLCRLSGIATHTRAWVDALAGTHAKVLDTRKTTPGLRALEKYAVRVGGGTNKRMGLYDVAMIKDNHKLAAGSITEAYGRVRAEFPAIEIQVEVTTVDEAREALGVGAKFLLCDNMSPTLLREVVAMVNGRAELEATGGLTLDRVREYADTGVGYLSVGALTHSSPIMDIALDLRR